MSTRQQNMFAPPIDDDFPLFIQHKMESNKYWFDSNLARVAMTSAKQHHRKIEQWFIVHSSERLAGREHDWQ